MRACAVTGISHFSDFSPPGYPVSLLYGERVKVGVEGFVTIVVAYDDMLSVEPVFAYDGNDPVQGSNYRRSGISP